MPLIDRLDDLVNSKCCGPKLPRFTDLARNVSARGHRTPRHSTKGTRLTQQRR
jgi:hypothetical protein